MNLLNDNSKEELKNFLIQNNISDTYCNLYFGIKDNVDIIEVHTLMKPDYPMFTFESNLDYSFKDIIDDFEASSKETLTQEFLLDAKYDNLLNEQTEGILIKFNNVNGMYVVYYQSTINGKTYTLNK